MLISYLPPVLQEISEFKIIMENGDIEKEELAYKIKDLENDQYFLDATEKGIKRYENMLSILPKGTDTLEDRKFRLLSRYNQQLPYTKTVLERQLITLCGEDGYSINMDYDNLILTVKIKLTVKAMYNEVLNYLNNIVPLNVIINLMLMYNQHTTLAKFTHNQLKQYTHDQLRNEVLV